MRTILLAALLLPAVAFAAPDAPPAPKQQNVATFIVEGMSWAVTWGGNIRRGLEGLPTIDASNVRQVGQNQFEITYEPEAIDVATLEATIRGLGFKPRLGKAVGVKLTSESLEVQAQVDKLSYKAGDKGRLLVGLFITKGHSLGGEGREATLIEVTAPGGVTVTKVETRIPGTLNERRKVLAIEFVVGEGAASGELDVSVSFQARGGKADGPQAMALRVPIAISVPAAGRALPKKLHGTWRSADGKVYVFSANGYEGDGASGRAELLGTEGAVLRLRLQRRGAEELWEIKLDGDTFTMSKPWSGQSFRRRDR